ncbi:MAG: hypothetical protein PHQ39_10070 [Methanothrix soehngenii]|nr:hypothetical protein [Methanothrix soehngenii]
MPEWLECAIGLAISEAGKLMDQRKIDSVDLGRASPFTIGAPRIQEE